MTQKWVHQEWKPKEMRYILWEIISTKKIAPLSHYIHQAYFQTAKARRAETSYDKETKIQSSKCEQAQSAEKVRV